VFLPELSRIARYANCKKPRIIACGSAILLPMLTIVDAHHSMGREYLPFDDQKAPAVPQIAIAFQ